MLCDRGAAPVPYPTRCARRAGAAGPTREAHFEQPRFAWK